MNANRGLCPIPSRRRRRRRRRRCRRRRRRRRRADGRNINRALQYLNSKSASRHIGDRRRYRGCCDEIPGGPARPVGPYRDSPARGPGGLPPPRNRGLGVRTHPLGRPPQLPGPHPIPESSPPSTLPPLLPRRRRRWKRCRAPRPRGRRGVRRLPTTPLRRAEGWSGSLRAGPGVKFREACCSARRSGCRRSRRGIARGVARARHDGRWRRGARCPYAHARPAQPSPRPRSRLSLANGRRRGGGERLPEVPLREFIVGQKCGAAEVLASRGRCPHASITVVTAARRSAVAGLRASAELGSRVSGPLAVLHPARQWRGKPRR